MTKEINDLMAFVRGKEGKVFDPFSQSMRAKNETVDPFQQMRMNTGIETTKNKKNK